MLVKGATEVSAIIFALYIWVELHKSHEIFIKREHWSAPRANLNTKTFYFKQAIIRCLPVWNKMYNKNSFNDQFYFNPVSTVGCLLQTDYNSILTWSKIYRQPLYSLNDQFYSCVFHRLMGFEAWMNNNIYNTVGCIYSHMPGWQVLIIFT